MDIISTGHDDLDEEVEKVVKLLVGRKTFPRQYIQRDLRIGYLRAQKIADKLEQLGIISSHEKAPPILVVNQRNVLQFLKNHA